MGSAALRIPIGRPAIDADNEKFVSQMSKDYRSKYGYSADYVFPFLDPDDLAASVRMDMLRISTPIPTAPQAPAVPSDMAPIDLPRTTRRSQHCVMIRRANGEWKMRPFPPALHRCMFVSALYEKARIIANMRRQCEWYKRNTARIRRTALCAARNMQYVEYGSYGTLWVERQCDIDAGVPSMRSALMILACQRGCILLNSTDVEGKEGDLRALFTQEEYKSWTSRCVSKSKAREKAVADALAVRVSGYQEVCLPWGAGRADIITRDNIIIEVKRYTLRYGAVDQIRRYGVSIPWASLCIHLFDCHNQRDTDFEEYCGMFDIEVTYDD
jgi:hypothetical protein